MSNAAQNVGNAPIVIERVGEAQAEPVEVREAGCLTGLATWICDCEDAGGLWKVFSYALRFFALLGSIITVVGVPFYILADREIVRVDFANDLRRSNMLMQPRALERAEINVVRIRGERDGLQNQAALDAQTIEGLRADVRRLTADKNGLDQTVSETTETAASRARDLIAAREQIESLQEQVQNLQEQDGGKLQQENDELREQINSLRTAIALPPVYDKFMAKVFGEQTPSKDIPGMVAVLNGLNTPTVRALDIAINQQRLPRRLDFDSAPQPRHDHKT